MGSPRLTSDHGAEAPGCWLAPEPTSGAGNKPRLPPCHPAEPRGRRWRRPKLAAAPRAEPRAAFPLGCGSASESPRPSLSLLPATHFLGRVIVRGTAVKERSPFSLSSPALPGPLRRGHGRNLPLPAQAGRHRRSVPRAMPLRGSVPRAMLLRGSVPRAMLLRGVSPQNDAPEGFSPQNDAPYGRAQGLTPSPCSHPPGP